MRYRFLFVIALLILVSCFGNNVKSAGYYQAYSAGEAFDVALYNDIFNQVKERFIEYVIKTKPNIPEHLGVIVELKSDNELKGLENIMSQPVLRAWDIMDSEIVPITGDVIEAMNHGFDTRLNNIPRAKFSVKINGIFCEVTVRYWVTQVYSYVFHYNWLVTGWVLNRVEEIEIR